MQNYAEGNNVFSRFGLTVKQTRIMFSIERLLVKEDISIEKDAVKKRLKLQWLNEWEKSIKDGLIALGLEVLSPNASVFLDRTQIINEIKKVNISSPENNTWYYLVMLEATLFIPYTPFNVNTNDKSELKEQIKAYKDLKYKRQTDFLEKLTEENHIMDKIYIKQFEKTYKNAISNAKGTKKKMWIITASIAMATALSFGIGSIFASSIATALVGSNFVGLSGAALANASLAFIGGGAIAAGGAGMAGGAAIIAGGAALLGGAVAGGAGGAVLAFSSSPEFTLSQAAKLEVVLREIILNAQKDVKFAQEVMKNMKSQIQELTQKLSELELEDKENKDVIKNLKKSIDYLTKVFKENNRFVSSFEEGTKATENTVKQLKAGE